MLKTAHRLAKLQQLTAALAGARGVDAVGPIVATVGREALGAVSALLWILDGDALVLRGHAGVPAEFVEPYRVLTAGSPSAAFAVFQTQQATWAETEDDYVRFDPEIARHAKASGRMLAFAAVPLVVEGRAVGLVAFSYPAPHAFDEDERAYIQTIAQQCAQALQTVQLMEAERAAREVAEESNRAKDEFLAILGHELRNPLAPIVSALELMALDPSKSVRARTVIERQVQHLRRLVDDLLDVSRLTRGKVELRKEIVDVSASVRDALSAMGPLISERGHDVAVELPSDLRVNGDPARLAQIFTNLLANAARYTPRKGAIAVTASLDGDHVVIRISDDGPGIPPELRPRLFAMFAQGERSLDRAEGGLGLGLAIVKALVEQHGGEVTVLDREPRGTVAEVRLPAAKGAYVEVRAQSSQPPLGTGLRVLVVDDNVDAATFLGELLQLNGCEVQIAHDGQAALDAAPAMTPDLAVLDLGLPVIDGYELADRLRAHPSLANMSIVALSGYAQDHDLERSQRAGFLEHLRKPLEISTLQRLLERLSRARQSSS